MSVSRRLRAAAITAVVGVATVAGAACTADPGGSTGGGIVTGCFGGVNTRYYSVTAERGIHVFRGHDAPDCSDGLNDAGTQVYHGTNQDFADAFCRGRLGRDDAQAFWIGQVMVPAQPNLYACV